MKCFNCSKEIDNDAIFCRDTAVFFRYSWPLKFNEGKIGYICEVE